MNFCSAFTAATIAAFSVVTAFAADTAITYPQTDQGAVVEDHFGEKIADPYRWLENDIRADEKVRDWVAAENKTTQDYLAMLPGHSAIKQRLTALYDYERIEVPRKAIGKTQNYYFYTENSGLQNQAVLFIRDGIDGTPRQLLDPNIWSKDGATALAEWRPSLDGAMLAYAIQDGGTDWRTVKVIDTKTGTETGDILKWVKFSNIAWAHDGSGFYYSRFPEPPAAAMYQTASLNQAIYFHRLGTPQTKDRLIYADPLHSELIHDAAISENGKWLIISSSAGSNGNAIALLDLTKTGAKPWVVSHDLTHDWDFIGAIGSAIVLSTNDGAPLKHILVVDAGKPDMRPREIVPATKSVIDNAAVIGNYLLVNRLVDAKSIVTRYTIDGQAAGEVPLPSIGVVKGFDGRSDDPESFFSFESLTTPAQIYHYDARSNAARVFAAPKLTFDANDYVSEQRFYTAKDGAKIPIFLAYRSGHDLTKPSPAMLYAYGGFNISVTPSFNPAALDWIEMGGVYAVANIRGGGEYGTAWHDAGRLTHKQTVFDDFIAAAEYLTAEHITAPDKLGIIGRSNGGLLIGAVTNQRPDLFAVALPAVGVMDMLRFHLFTEGHTWTEDYGDPDKAADFKVLRAYSPYHNIRSGVAYPAIMVTTADTDDRVIPGHSFKYAAALQAAAIGNKPHLIRIETRAGHGSGKPVAKRIDEYADLWAFAAYWTGLKVENSHAELPSSDAGVRR